MGLYGWDPHMLSNTAAKCDGQRHCGSVAMFLVFHVILA